MKIRLLDYIAIILLSGTCINSANDQYDVLYKNFSLTHNQDAAVLIVAFNRPDYLKSCIKSLEQNPESQTMPFIFALDGGIRSKQKENSEVILRSTIKNKIILCRSRNYGCPKNHIDSKRFAFDWCGFKKVIVIEEDVEVTPSYIRFLLNLYRWSKKNYENVGIVQAWTYCYLSNYQKRQKLNLVRKNPLQWSFVTYCIDKECWDKIKPIVYRYEQFIDQIPLTPDYDKARSKPLNWDGVHKIKAWVHSLIQENINKLDMNSSLLQFYLGTKFVPNQDEMMGFSFYMHNLDKIQTLVNRARHIGERGITSTEILFYQHNYDKITLDCFGEDKNMKTFKMICNQK